MSYATSYATNENTSLVAIKMPFNNDVVKASNRQDTMYADVGSVIDNLGLTRQMQVERLRRHPLYRKYLISEVYNDLIVKAMGRPKIMYLLPTKYLKGWLMTINPRCVRADLVDTLVAYQERCCDAIEAYFTPRANPGIGTFSDQLMQAFQEGMRPVLAAVEDMRNRMNVVETRTTKLEQAKPLRDSPLRTVAYWARIFGESLTHGESISAGSLAAKLYRQTYQVEPKQVRRFYGQTEVTPFVYGEDDKELMSQVINTVTATRGVK